MTQSARRPATLDDFWAIPEAARFHELIGGDLSPKSAPTGEHGDAQAGIVGAIRPAFQRTSDNDGRGSWSIVTDVDVLLLNQDVVRPDVLGWRRDHCPEGPTGSPVRARPDWICEVVSPTRATDDTVKKLRLYHRAEIPHYWIADPRDATLTVMRWNGAGYVTVLRAERHETVRAEPFESVELFVGSLFGDDSPEL